MVLVTVNVYVPPELAVGWATVVELNPVPGLQLQVRLANDAVPVSYTHLKSAEQVVLITLKVGMGLIVRVITVRLELLQPVIVFLASA